MPLHRLSPSCAASTERVLLTSCDPTPNLAFSLFSLLSPLSASEHESTQTLAEKPNTDLRQAAPLPPSSRCLSALRRITRKPEKASSRSVVGPCLSLSVSLLYVTARFQILSFRTIVRPLPRRKPLFLSLSLRSLLLWSRSGSLPACLTEVPMEGRKE